MNPETPKSAETGATPSKLDALLGTIEGSADLKLAAHLLQIDPDAEYAGLLESVLPELLSGACRVERVVELADGLALLEQLSYDAILLASDAGDENVTAALRSLHYAAPDTPVIVLAADGDDDHAGRTIAAGAYDVVPRSHADPYLLARSIQTAVTRRSSQARQRPVDNGNDVRQTQVVDMMNSRKAERFPLIVPATLIPILSDGRPDVAVEGTTFDISSNGVGLRIPVEQQLSQHRFILGIGHSASERSFVACKLVHRRATPEAIEIGAVFLEGESNPFHPDKLKPAFDPRTCTYRTSLNDVAATGWLAAGVLQPMLFDYVSACPDCTAAASFREGCGDCGSARTGRSRLIHHFACAHVELAEDFDNNGQLSCPKCRQQKLVVGADFEYFDGPFRCLDCEWSDVELAPIGQCLRCGLRFPGREAVRKELICYHVNRLDPLALVP